MTDFNLQEIHEENFRLKVHTILEQEIQDFASSKGCGFEKISSCPACHEKKVKYCFTCLGLRYEECMTCHTIFINPFPTEDMIVNFINTSEGLRIWREDMPLYLQESRKKLYSQRLNIVLENTNLIEKDSLSLLEIGGGRGEFAKELWKSKKFNKIYVVEPQELAIDIENIQIIRNTFQQISLKSQVDIVVAFEVFEHILEPWAFLEKAFECLQPGGILILTTPNGKSLEVDILREQSSQVPFDHVRLYNPYSLEHMLQKTGFSKVTISTPGKLDVELIERTYKNKTKGIPENHFLQFILERQDQKLEFQDYIVRNHISSHMRCIAHKPVVSIKDRYHG